MKKLLVSIIMLLLLCSCDNTKEKEKTDYLAFKSELQKTDIFTSIDELPCDINISVDRVNDEEISYRAIIDNVTEDMYNIKAMVIHNNFTEDIFPSIGIFDEPENLVVGSESLKGIELVGYIETDKDISDFNLEIKVWIEYQDKDGNSKNIYYKTTK